MEPEGRTEEQTERRWGAVGCLWTLVKLPFRLALALARMGVMLVAFAGGAVAAGLAGGALAWQVDLVHAIVGAPLAGVMFLVGLILGLAGWFVPATLRVHARGGDVELDREIPTRSEAVWFLLASWVALAGLGWVWADLVDVVPAWPPMLALTAIGTVAVAGIVLTGGRHVADLFVLVVGALAG